MKEPLLTAFGRGTISFPAELFPIEGFRGVHDEPHARLVALKTQEDAWTIFSSDVTGAALRLLEERTGAVTLFCMTAAGDQVPVKQTLYDTVTTDGLVLQSDEGPEKGLEYVAELGKILAEDVAASVEKIVCTENVPMTDVAKCTVWLQLLLVLLCALWLPLMGGAFGL